MLSVCSYVISKMPLLSTTYLLKEGQQATYQKQCNLIYSQMCL